MSSTRSWFGGRSMETRRRARDLWVSRSQLYAGLVGSVALVIISFSVGYDRGVEAGKSEQAALQVGWLETASDEALVELLARVEASAEGNGSRLLTFPDALGGKPTVGGETLGDVAVVSKGAAVVAPGGNMDVFADPVPAGSFTVRTGIIEDASLAREERARLRAAGFPAWISVRKSSDALHYIVQVGGFRKESAAQAVAGEVAEVLVQPPQVVSL